MCADKKTEEEEKNRAAGCSTCGPEDEFMREIAEEVRLKQLAEFWKKHGSFIISLGLAVLLGVSLRQGIEYYRRTRKYNEMIVYEAGASDEAKLSAMKDELRYGFGRAASAELLRRYLERGESDKAVALLQEELARADDDFMRELIELKLAYVQAARDPQAAAEKAGRLMTSGKYLRDFAYELNLALLSGAEQKAALEKALADPELSAAVKQSAALMLLKKAAP